LPTKENKMNVEVEAGEKSAGFSKH
jgi:uncharacterized protein (DUF1684 family)